jgi:small subunit ribosomal protein S16
MTRRGAKKDPYYRVIVTERSSPRDGRFVEIVGHYNPAQQPVLLHLDLPRVDYWIGQGARPTRTVNSLIRRVREEAKAAPGLEAAAPEQVLSKAEPEVQEQPQVQ